MSDLFDLITPYWIGFLFADGHMRIRNKDYAYMLACELQTRDLAHLEYMCDDLRKRRNIRERKRYRFGKEYRSTIGRIYSVELCRLLRSFGWHDFKAGDPSCLDKLSNEQFRHWLRGFMDGDGSICRGLSGWKCAKRYIQVLWYSPHKPILEYISSRLSSILDVNNNAAIKSKIFTVQWMGLKALKILDWLYENAGRYLARKHELYCKYKKLELKRDQTYRDHLVSEEQVKEMIELAKSNHNSRIISNKLGLHIATVRGHLKKHGVSCSRKRIVTDDIFKSIILLRESGLSAMKIAAKLDIGHSTVWRAIRCHQASI